MGRNTRAVERFTPPPTKPEGKEATGRTKTRFFDAYDEHFPTKSIRQIYQGQGIGESTGRLWRDERKNMGWEASNPSRAKSAKLGRRSKITRDMVQMLIDPKRNPVRNQPYEAQIVYHKLLCKVRQLRRKIKEYTRNAKRYKIAFVKKEISSKNKEERVDYGEYHTSYQNNDFWTTIVFTDEAYVDPKA